MFRSIKLITAATLALTAAGAASAQGLNTDWSGAYAGLSVATGETEVVGVFTLDNSNFGAHAGYLHDMGNVVIGGELEVTQGELEIVNADTQSTRLKGIIGYDAGQFLAYGVAGVSELDINGTADDMVVLGAGGSYAINDQFRIGAEILMETNDDFAGTGFEVNNQEIALRADYAF